MHPSNRQVVKPLVAAVAMALLLACMATARQGAARCLLLLCVTIVIALPALDYSQAPAAEQPSTRSVLRRRAAEAALALQLPDDIEVGAHKAQDISSGAPAPPASSADGVEAHPLNPTVQRRERLARMMSAGKLPSEADAAAARQALASALQAELGADPYVRAAA